MSDKRSLALVTQPQDFFRELVSEALGKQKLTTQPETEFYLVNLLNQFMTTDRLYSKDSEGGNRDEALAILVKEALEQPMPQAQKILFRRIGDVSLYTAGFFQESLNRKRIEVEYYIDVGGTAYQQVANRADEDVLKNVYEELSAKFAELVEVLADVSEKTLLRSEKDLLRLYERWVRTRSERAARALHEAGIVPNENFGKKLQ